MQICPADLPFTLLVWGKSRVVPVRLTSFSVTEEAFDPALNPIQAKVDLGMRVLTYMELKEDTVGFGAYIAYQAQKEVLARAGTARRSGAAPFAGSFRSKEDACSSKAAATKTSATDSITDAAGAGDPLQEGPLHPRHAGAARRRGEPGRAARPHRPPRLPGSRALLAHLRRQRALWPDDLVAEPGADPHPACGGIGRAGRLLHAVDRRCARQARSCSQAIQQIEVEDHADMADMLRLRVVDRREGRLLGWSVLDDRHLPPPDQASASR